MSDPGNIKVGANLDIIKKRSLFGVVSLVSRSFLVQGIAFASNFLLTIFLDPGTFGIFFLVSAFVNFFSYFSDIGLAAALIQKKEQVSDEDLKTTFLVQQILVIALLVIILAISPLARKWYGLNQSAILLLYAIGISFFLSSLKTIPSVLLERDLKFNLLVIPQLVETLVFNLVAVLLAWRGFGIASFTWAVLIRGLVGFVLIYIISPWKIGFAFSKNSFSRLLKFGIPYQTNTIIAVVKDDLMTMFLGKVIGTAGLGYLGWAKKWAEMPLRFLMDNVLKVTFPAFSRLQDNRENLKQAVEKSLFFLCFLTFPILVGFSVLASDLVKIIPRYLKWQPAVLALYLYCFNSAWATVSTLMTNLLNAVGKIKTTFKLMVMWLVLTWGLMPVLGIRFGYNGVAAATSIIATSSIAAIYLAKKESDFDLISSVGKPLVAAGIMGVLVFLIKPAVFSLSFSVLVRVLLGAISYAVVSYFLIGSSLFGDFSKIYHEIKKNH